jgi:hypothetical protein
VSCGGGHDEEGCGGERCGGGRGSNRGLTGPRPGIVSGRGQEVCGSMWLHPTGQMSLQGCLETSVCPALSPFFPFFILLLLVMSRSSPSGAAAVTGATAVDAIVELETSMAKPLGGAGGRSSSGHHRSWRH